MPNVTAAINFAWQNDDRATRPLMTDRPCGARRLPAIFLTGAALASRIEGSAPQLAVTRPAGATIEGALPTRRTSRDRATAGDKRLS